MCYNANMSLPKKFYDDLYELLSSMENPSEAKNLCADLFTPAEIDSFAERWQEIQLLAKKLPQREVAKKLGISISKVTRGSRMLQHGSGAFQHFLKKLGKN